MSSSLRSFILFTFMDGVMISLGLALTLFVIFTYGNSLYLTQCAMQIGKRIFTELFVARGTEITGKIEGSQYQDPTHVQMSGHGGYRQFQ